MPVGKKGRRYENLSQLILDLNAIAGRHGIGRIDIHIAAIIILSYIPNTKVLTLAQ